MTIKKIGLSAIAVAVLSTAALAAGNGSISLDGIVGKFSNELISNKSVDTNNTKRIDYTCGIVNASASEPGFELKLVAPAGISASSDVSGNFGIYKADDNTSIATFDRYDSTAHSIIFKKVSGASISRGVKYVIGDSNVTGPVDGEMQINVAKASKAVSAHLIVTDNTGTTVLDDPTTVIMQGADQFAMSIDQKFDAQIDASLAFKEFHGNPSDQDTVGFSIANNKAAMTSGIVATASKIKLDIVADQNLTTYKVTEKTNSGADDTAITTGDITLSSDYNLTTLASAPDNNFSDAMTATLITDKTGAMSVTHFKATGFVDFNGFSKTLLSAVDAGAWTIYGYNAQIPNVISKKGFATTIKFTNRSSLDTNIYFTLIDQDGTIESLNSIKNPSLAALPANTTGVYSAAELLKLVTNPDFDKTHSFSVEVSIPTTPTSVYGFASWKNTGLGTFKDLPIYNTSTMTY